jgi:uracil-DNA glycosylase
MPKPNLQRALKQHLQTDRLLGVVAVPIHAIARPVGPGLDDGHPVAARSTIPAIAPASPVAPVTVAASTAPPITRSPLTTRGAPVASAPPGVPLFAPAPKGVTLPVLDVAARVAALNDMDVNEVRSCKKCELCQGRTQTVFGEGDPAAKIMFVGEGPGQTEDETGRPFVGKAGELLEKMIVAMGLSREKVFIANIVKCRPPNNRPPTPGEVDACAGYLIRQISLIQPAVIVALGGPSSKFILQTQVGITALRGTFHEFHGLHALGGPTIPVMPTFHPAYILRAYTPENRAKVWSDLKLVMERVGLPVPAK